MKKKHLILAISLVVILIGAGTSISYFTSQDSADNNLTVGKVDIELTEDPWDPDEDHVIAADAEFEKKPVVKNVGDNAAYVRLNVKVDSFSIIEGSLLAPGADMPKVLFGDTLNETHWESADAPKEEGDAKIYSFYYKQPLEVGSSTEPLFTKVKFDSAIFDTVKIIEELDSTFDISVSADAIQAQGFDNSQDAFTAFDNQ